MVTGRIASLAGDAGAGWVEAIAVAGGRVVAGGRRTEVVRLAGPGTRRLDLAPDEVALPGLTDAHLHLVEAALARARVDLEGSSDMEELLGRIRSGTSVADGPPTWIEGGGWDVDALGRWPTADDLDRAAPGRLVALWAHDHHALLASRASLEAAGIDAGRRDPAGGVIRRSDDGTPTGVLHENAARLVADLVPAPTVEAIAAALGPLTAELVALGVVAVHDPGGLSIQAGLGGPFAAYRGLAAAGRLGVRVHVCLRPEQLETATGHGLRSGEPLGPDPLDRLRLGWLKTFADGSLGSRTAALLAPIERGRADGVPGWGSGTDDRGIWLLTPEALADQAAGAARVGIATQIHAIGDAAVRAALDALAPTVGLTALMPRVEHAQLVEELDIPRFAELGIAASMQPVHIRSDAGKARRLWGSRADARAFPMAALANAGAVLAIGTDAPVEPIDPWPGVACAVTRRAPTWPAGTEPLGQTQAVSLWRAIRAACVGPVVTAGELDRGRLVPGCRADLIVLGAAAVGEPVEPDGALWHARPRLVLMDGEIVAGS